MTSFSIKKLRITLILAGTNAVFPGTNSNTLIIDDLRATVQVQQNARFPTQANARIFGMRVEDMNALTVAWANPPIVLNHIVIIEANNGDGYAQVFKGTITEAQPNYHDMPNVSFELSAQTGYFQKISAAEPTSYPAATTITAVASDLVKRMGFTFVDGGASATFAKGAYFWGSLWDQLAQACQAANADFYTQGDSITVTPAGKPSAMTAAVILGPDSGLVGYPSYERAGLNVEALFNPALSCGLPIDLQSSVPNATGRWYPYLLNHVLESRTPNGAWYSQLKCLRVLV